jgi:hypothetical protein
LGRRHRAEQFGLVSHHGQIADRLATIGQHHRQIDQHPPRIVPRLTLPQRGHRTRELLRQAGHLGQIRKQP